MSATYIENGKLNGKTTECKRCSEKYERTRPMSDYHRNFVEWLLDNRIVGYDSCIICVEKHIGTAMQAYKELIDAIGSGTNGKATVTIELNHLTICGELELASKESYDFKDLHTALLDARRRYQYDGIEPDWHRLAELILQYKH